MNLIEIRESLRVTTRTVVFSKAQFAIAGTALLGIHDSIMADIGKVSDRIAVATIEVARRDGLELDADKLCEAQRFIDSLLTRKTELAAKLDACTEEYAKTRAILEELHEKLTYAEGVAVFAESIKQLGAN